MARVAIFGGHGKVALLAEPLLVEAGHEVTAFIRNADQGEDVAATGAVPRLFDVEQAGTEDIAEALEGHEVVIWSAGAGGGSPERTRAVDHEAAVRSIDAAARAGATRYVMVSYFGAGPDHGVDPENAFFTYAEAKAAADAHLRGTDLEWTVLGPSGLTDDDATGAIELGGRGVEGGQVTRADVAAVVTAAVARPDLVGRTIEFNNGDTPIAEALDAVASR